MSHSIIPPSSAGIWGKPEGCTGWVLMTQQYPELEVDPEALDGEASHEAAAEMINNAARGVTETTYRNTLCRKAANGVVINEDMIEGARIYADDVIDVMRSTAVFGGDNLGIEKRLKIPMIHEQHFGTPDCFLMDRRNGRLYIWDYKYGHVVVEAFENWQAICYSAGIAELLGIDGLASQFIEVHIRIVQPRAHHREGVIREWVTTLSDLRGYWNIIKSNAHKALSNQAECKTGSHCKYCTARYACEPALRAGMNLFEVAGKPLPVELTPLTVGVQLSIIKRAIQQLTCLETGYEAQIESLIRSGVNVPGWTPETQRGREKWAKPIKEIITLGEMMGVNLKKPDNVITPNQARKLGIDAKVIKEYSIIPSNGIKIIEENGNKAKQLFGVKNHD